MAPPSGLHQSAIPSDFDAPFPSLSRATVAAGLTHRADPSHLAPEDAFLATSPPQGTFDGVRHRTGVDRPARRLGHGGSRSRSRTRRRKRFQKLLWVKQSYPDNYTDQATFLENLQRNPRLKPYDFWPLVADSTVIVQHVCSVIIFVVCFVGIFQERVSPVSVVGLGSLATFIGWMLWDWWVGQEESDDDAGLDRIRNVRGERIQRERRRSRRQDCGLGAPTADTSTTCLSTCHGPSNATCRMSSSTVLPHDHHQRPRLGGSGSGSGGSSGLSNGLRPRHAHSISASSVISVASLASTYPASTARGGSGADASPAPRFRTTAPSVAGRGSLRFSTIKSAVLIYFTLLGLSPILKSLTRSTSSDSIWAMSFWLLAINIFFFDYSGGWVGVNKFPIASLSTNAALMASTVLASRLPSTGQVFSLTLFSIEVFGLFPVFRRYARHRSWRYHVVLTVLLVLGAGGGVGMVLGGDGEGWAWKNGLLGMFGGCLVSAVAMGGCSWWLIGLQKYKNEIYGPWDPARPIIISRRYWDGD